MSLTNYSFTITCDDCGGLLEHHAEAGWTRRERKAVAKCTGCRADWFVSVTMSKVRETKVKW